MKSADVPETLPAGAPPVIRWRKVIILMTGQALSLTGDYVLLVALAWTAVQLGGATAITVLMLAGALPRAVTLIFSGAVTDMLGARFVLLRTTSARAVLLAAGAVVTLTTPWFWPLVVIAAIEGILLGFGSPANSTLLPKLAEGDHLARANSLSAMITRLAPIVGSPIGAWLIAVGDLWQAMAVVAVTGTISFAAAVVVTAGMPGGTRTSGETLLRHTGDGIRLLRAHARLRWLFVCAFLLDLAFGWPLEVALPVLVDARGWGVDSVAVVVVAFSAGALVAGLAGALLAHRLPLSIRLVATGVGIGLGILVMASTTSLAALVTVGVLVGLMAGLNGPAIVTVYQQASPPARLGTAMSMLTLAGIGTTPVSIALFGALSAVIGLHATWMVCGAVALAAPLAAVKAMRRPAPDPQSPAAPEVVAVPEVAMAAAETAPAVPEVSAGGESRSRAGRSPVTRPA